MRFCVEHSIMKKVVSVIIILCFLLNLFVYLRRNKYKIKAINKKW